MRILLLLMSLNIIGCSDMKSNLNFGYKSIEAYYNSEHESKNFNKSKEDFIKEFGEPSFSEKKDSIETLYYYCYMNASTKNTRNVFIAIFKQNKLLQLYKKDLPSKNIMLKKETILQHNQLGYLQSMKRKIIKQKQKKSGIISNNKKHM